MKELIITIEDLAIKLNYSVSCLRSLLDNYQLTKFTLFKSQNPKFKNKRYVYINSNFLKILKKLILPKIHKRPAMYNVYLNLCNLEKELIP